MHDWRDYVRENLKLVGISSEREQEAIQEVARQLDDAYSDALARGMSEAEAETFALQHIPDWTAFCRELQRTNRYRSRKAIEFANGPLDGGSIGANWGFHVNTVVRDVLYAGRLLRKHPAFTAIVVLSLALGIGANTVIFSMVNAFFLRSLPYSDPDGLVMVWFTPPNRPPLDEGGRGGATRRNCLDVRARAHTLDITCLQQFQLNIGQDEPGSVATERVLGHQFGGDFPKLVGINPLIGRWYTADEERVDAAPVMLISYNQWQKRFNGVPDVLGKQLRVDGTLTKVIGVMPEGFFFWDPNIEYWAPFRNPPNVAGSSARFLILPARLRTGMTLDQAQSEMNTLAVALAEDNPATNKDWTIHVEPLGAALSAGLTQPILTFQGAVLFVLLIACANVAGLLLAQGSARQKEVAIRLALGSSRWRIVRESLTQSVLLAVIGGLCGIALGWAGLQVLLRLIPPLGMGEIAIDWNVFAFTLLLSVVTGLGFGILPALQVSRSDVTRPLRENTRSATSSRTRGKMRGAFVVVQISLALVLLTGAGLMMKSFLKLNSIKYGFDQRDLTTFQIQFPRGEFSTVSDQTTPTGALTVETSPRLQLVVGQIREHLAAIPGVQQATATVSAPLVGGFPQYSFAIDGRPPATSDREAFRSEWNAVFPDYFETLRVPLARGRQFNAEDFTGGEPVVIVSETMAKRFWPNEDPIGKRIQIGIYKDLPREIIGIVGDVRQAVRQREQMPQVYVPYSQLPLNQEGRGFMFISFVVRSSLEMAALVPALRAAVVEVDRTQAMYDIQTPEQFALSQIVGPRVYLTLLIIFGGVALFLSVIGVYGITSYSVTQRTNEIGIRVALGAGPRDVLKLVLRHGLILVAFGLFIGVAASFALTQFIQNVLWQITPTDPQTFALSLLVLAGVALIACYIPARRALKISPIVALRHE